MTQLFNLRSASVQFGPVHALADCALCIQAGERVALIGANGSGKSTLLRLLLGVDRPLYGKVKRTGDKRYLPAHPALAPAVSERTLPFTEQKHRLLEQITWTEAAYYFDEPTAGLTDSQRMLFIQKMSEHPQALIVLATHDPDVIIHATRIVYLVQGEIAFDGPSSVFTQQSRLYAWD